MAIKRYQTSDTGLINPSAAVTWLNENKTGTVLEDVTISSENPSSNLYKLLFTKDTNVITLYTSNAANVTGSAYTFHFIQFNGMGLGGVSLYNSSSAEQVYLGIRHLILCKYGIIIGIVSRTGTSTPPSSSYNAYSYHTPLLITVDDTGKLVVVTPYITPFCGYSSGKAFASYVVNMGSYCITKSNGYRIKNETSPRCDFNIVSTESIYATVLHQFCGYYYEGTSFYTPFAYYATTDQYVPHTNSELGVVTMNGDTFITNGIWYIKDDDD